MKTKKHPIDSLLHKIRTKLTRAEREALGMLLETTAVLLATQDRENGISIPPPSNPQLN